MAYSGYTVNNTSLYQLTKAGTWNLNGGTAPTSCLKKWDSHCIDEQKKNLFFFAPIYTPITVQVNSPSYKQSRTSISEFILKEPLIVLNHIKVYSTDHFSAHKDLHLQQVCAHWDSPLAPPEMKMSVNNTNQSDARVVEVICKWYGQDQLFWA